jgi:UDP-glucose-4-epimerase GalE
MIKILVTGGAGYIGSHVCKALAGSGYLPITYDNLSRGNQWAVKWGPLEQGDIADRACLSVVLARHRPSAVMHFAAFAYVEESIAQPLLYYRNNVTGTVSFLQTLIDYQPLPFVLSSSCATYGLPEKLPISEEHPQRPINPYGFSKLIAERMLTDFGVAYGLPSISLRYFNAAGADPEGELGEAHDPETHLIPRVIRAACMDTTIQVFGIDYDTPDGTCVRDYVHVTDIADAHVRALDYLLSGGTSCALNLSNSHGYSIKEVITAAEHVCGRSIRLEAAPRRVGDPPILIGDARRARAVLGWEPVRSNLKVQIADALKWMKTCSQDGTQRHG